MLETWFLIVPSLGPSAAAISALLRPAAISASTSVSRAVSGSTACARGAAAVRGSNEARVRSLGGELRAGDAAHGGFEIELSLPAQEGAR